MIKFIVPYQLKFSHLSKALFSTSRNMSFNNLQSRSYPKRRSLDLFRNALQNPQLHSEKNKSFKPVYDLKETKDSYEAEIELPGYSKENVKISLEPELNRLKVRGKAEPKEEKDVKYHMKKRHQKDFKLVFELPEDTDFEKNIQAKFENGVLHFKALKKVAEQPKRVEIEIQ